MSRLLPFLLWPASQYRVFHKSDCQIAAFPLNPVPTSVSKDLFSFLQKLQGNLPESCKVFKFLPLTKIFVFAELALNPNNKKNGKGIHDLQLIFSCKVRLFSFLCPLVWSMFLMLSSLEANARNKTTIMTF